MSTQQSQQPGSACGGSCKSPGRQLAAEGRCCHRPMPPLVLRQWGARTGWRYCVSTGQGGNGNATLFSQCSSFGRSPESSLANHDSNQKARARGAGEPFVFHVFHAPAVRSLVRQHNLTPGRFVPPDTERRHVNLSRRGSGTERETNDPVLLKERERRAGPTYVGRQKQSKRLLFSQFCSSGPLGKLTGKS
eukprot:COSAG06_NODE_5994_length_3163_cov_2.033616_3_plen_191_part_00